MSSLKSLGKDFYDIRKKYIHPFSKPAYHYDASKGFIVWRLGTGENVELLHIKVIDQMAGYGRWLFYEMLKRLETEMIPYHSIFGFTRVTNDTAKKFYEAIGFNLQPVQGLYKDGEAIMFWQEYVTLLQRMKEHQA